MEDPLRDDDVIAAITIRIHRSGAMQVAGNIQQEALALSMIDAARDSVRSYHMKQHGSVLIPAGAH
jgi:hypothetical protein